MFARVAILAAPWLTLDYALPVIFPSDFFRPGLRVLVPMGKQLSAGVILRLVATPSVDFARCRPIFWPLELKPLISPELLAVFEQLALRQCLSPGQVLGHLLPAGLRRNRLKILWHGCKDLSGACNPRNITAQQLRSLDPANSAALAADFLAGRALILREKEDLASREMLSLACDPPWPVRPAARVQREILDLLLEQGTVSRRQLLRQLGTAAAEPLKKLMAQKFVTVQMEELEATPAILQPPAEPAFQLNECQREAVDALKAALARGDASYLLYGVTGSGKTAVYLDFARFCLEQGRSVLLLAPEVALAHKLFRDVEQALPQFSRYLYHGYQNASCREQTFRALAENSEPVVVTGTRSAVFLPVASLGCIIMDEEHDGSYKQDENLVYHAREVAWYRAKQAHALLILGSATPDLRTFFAAENAQLPRITLPNRVGGAKPPPIELIQLGAKAGKDGAGLLAEPCEQALMDCLNRGDQAVVLLNRRGYAPLVWCVNCNKVVSCPNCQIGMAYHKKIGRLSCHFCGHSIPWPNPCPQCGHSSFVAMGEGTERLAERLEALAGAPVLRLDRDNARRPGKIEEILTAFGTGESPFLVGTQMLSKGHHFPNVTLVIVADGDIGLNLPDYRASERTFQLLMQAAGRAGRGTKPGRAFIQTRNKGHYCWDALVRYDYEAFYAAEIARRRKYRFPPFVRLGLLRLSFPIQDDEADAECRKLGAELRTKAKSLSVNFYGPVAAPFPVLQGRRRMHCMMKGAEWGPMRQLWLFAQQRKAAKQLRITLDLDPVDMM